MARIRTIKPEFWRDGRIAKLSHSCALFFIGLWNFCDDEGKIKSDPFELSLSLPSFRSQDIVKHLRRLTEVGLVRSSVNREWIVVENWNHQKIDKPKHTKLSKLEIEWLPLLTEDHSTTIRRQFDDSSTNVRRKDSIVKDSKGKERIITPPGNLAVLVEEKSGGSLSYDAYNQAYKQRYGQDAVRNKGVNTLFKRLHEKLGNEAPEVARFYVSHNDFLYAKSGHAVSLLVRDAEKLRTEWATGNKITTSSAKAQESVDHYAEQLALVRKGLL